MAVKAQNYQNTWESLDKRPIPAWFENAKFGILVCWGPYSVPSWRRLEARKFGSYAEWYYASVMDNEGNGGKAFHEANYGKDFEYRQFAPLFRAELWDPDRWARVFNDAGARYVVLTAKYHDGYSLWPTKVPHKKDWNSMNVGPKRDLVGDLTKAVRNAGLKMGLYYSIPDWESVPLSNGEYQINQKAVDKYGVDLKTYVNEICNPQLKELVLNYKPSVIFADAGEWTYDDEFWKTKELLSWLYNDSPVKDEIVVNDRFFKGMPGKHGDYASSEYADVEVGSRPWEESRGMGGSYGYNRAENLHDYQSSEQLIHELIDVVSRGGNMLLNVGPTADGRIPVIQQQRLHDIGQWLKTNGEAIYNTRKHSVAGIKSAGQQLYFTSKNNDLYCIFTRWHDSVEVDWATGNDVKNVSLLGYDGRITWKITEGNKLTVEIPKLTIEKIPCLHAWSLKIERHKKE